MRKWAFVVLGMMAMLGGSAASRAATVMVTSDISVSTTWTADNEYVLTKPIYVTSGATLTIEPGTVVRGEPTSGANDPGALAVTRGSKIRAVGNSFKPIVFTDLGDNNIGTNPGTFPYDTKENALSTTGNWGGVILLGRGYVANNTTGAPNNAREFQIEGLTAPGGVGLYGNCAGDLASGCDDDDSGEMSYVSIRYGGFTLSGNNEVNGLTLGGVGRNTDLSHIEVFQNKDDGFEMFGGAVNLKNVVVGLAGDDSIDYDEGWRGKVQFAFIAQGVPATEPTDKGGEHDGGNNPDNSLPLTIPTIYNATFIGLGEDKTTYTLRAKNTALHFRDNAGGRYRNSFFGDFGGAPLIVEGTATSCSGADSSGARYQTTYASVADGNFYRETLPGGGNQLDLQDTTFWCIGTAEAGDQVPGGRCTVSLVDCCSNADCTGGGGDTCGDAPAQAAGGDTGKIHRNTDTFTNGALENSYLGCLDPLPIRVLTRTLIGPATVPDPINMIDPRPAVGSPLLGSGDAPPADGFFTATDYRGAFLDENWADGWTAMARLGYFPAPEQQLVTADIATSQTWSPAKEYVLTKPIYVTSGATLTILPGTVVRGEPTSGANDPGALAVTRGSKINAVGTPDRPIVFTDLTDNNFGASRGDFPYDTKDNVLSETGHWGGVILLGRGYVANNTSGAPNNAREFQIEGLTAPGGVGLYGNCAGNLASGCDDDDSGDMAYVSIRYGGFTLSGNNEVNGLTLGGVGRNTNINNIEVFQNKDDGFEMFGGAVDLRNIVVGLAGDDSIDYDEGWRGRVQFALVAQGVPATEPTDKGGEHDGGNNPDNSQPLTIPTIYNATFVGLGQAQPNYPLRAKNTALHFRDNAGGRYYNSWFGDFGGAPLIVEGTATSCSGVDSSGARYGTAYVTDGSFYRDPAGGNQLDLRNNAFWCVGTAHTGDHVPGGRCTVSLVDCCSNADCTGGGGDTCGDAPAQAAGGDTGKIHRNTDTFSNVALDNDYLSCASASGLRMLTRLAIPDATLVPEPLVLIDPRPASGTTLNTDRKAPTSGFFSPASHKGAFDGTNWAHWTAMGRLGYFPSCQDGAVPDEVTNFRFGTSRTAFSWSAPALSGFMGVHYYDILRSTVPDNLSGAACVADSNAYDTAGSDTTTPPSGQTFYYLVRAVNNCGTEREGILGYYTNGTEIGKAPAPLAPSCP